MSLLTFNYIYRAVAIVGLLAFGVGARAQSTATHTPDFLPPPPMATDEAGKADQRIFDLTRALQGSARWELAAHDASLATPDLLADFSCAAGFFIDATRAPHLVGLLDKFKAFIKPAVSAEKTFWHRPRPFVGSTAPLCVARPPGKVPSFAYPSGHATNGWATALLLARLIPDRAPEIMTRGRVFGESRVVCGVHWASDVWAGYMNGAVLFDEFIANPANQAIIHAAASDVALLRHLHKPADTATCAVERGATGTSPLTQAR